MSPSDRLFLVMVLLGFGVVSGAIAWLAPLARKIWAPAALLLLLGAAAVATTVGEEVAIGDGQEVVLVTLGGLLAVVGGGPLTALVFDLVDRREPASGSPDASSGESLGAAIDRAGRVLRGGAWIGALERIAVYASLLAGWPEGIALVLAIKGLGRYPELRAAEDGVRTGAAERFIIGTFTSVLWACACAGTVLVAQ